MLKTTIAFSYVISTLQKILNFSIMTWLLSKWVGPLPIHQKLRFMHHPGGSDLWLEAMRPITTIAFSYVISTLQKILNFSIMTSLLSKWVGPLPIHQKLRSNLHPGGSDLLLDAMRQETNLIVSAIYQWFMMGKSLITGNMRSNDPSHEILFCCQMIANILGWKYLCSKNSYLFSNLCYRLLK